MTENPIIYLDDLSCKIGYRYLLRHIHWQIRRGEHWAVLGMNGCGKTTLLSIIAGFLPFSSGNLQVFGETYQTENILALRKRIGFVSASFFDRYYQNETALEIILSALFGSFGLDAALMNADIRRARQIMARLAILDKADQPYKTLSKGERQAILIARALFSQPEILLLDEPCSGLDVKARENMLQLIRTFALYADTTLIYVTHYLEEVRPEC